MPSSLMASAASQLIGQPGNSHKCIVCITVFSAIVDSLGYLALVTHVLQAVCRSLQHNKRPTEAELVKVLALLHEAVNSARWVLRGRHHGHVGHLQHNSRVDAVINLVYSCLKTGEIVW